MNAQGPCNVDLDEFKTVKPRATGPLLVVPCLVGIVAVGPVHGAVDHQAAPQLPSIDLATAARQFARATRRDPLVALR